MDAGRQLDILIAEKLFKTKVKKSNRQHGWHIDYIAADDKCNDSIVTDWGTDGHVLKKYSTDEKSAFLVLEKLKGLLKDNQGVFLQFSFYSNVWMGAFYSTADCSHEKVQSPDLPHAICLL